MRQKLRLPVALQWAELGESVWYISRQKISQLPSEFAQNIDKEALKQLIFLYGLRIQDVATKFQEIHMWNKIPRVIIVQDLDQYWKDVKDGDWKDAAAYFCSLLLDSAAVYSVKQQKMSYLIASSSKPKNEAQSFIYGMYFRFVFDLNKLGYDVNTAALELNSICNNAEKNYTENK